MDTSALIARLRAENEELRERIAQLEAAFSTGTVIERLVVRVGMSFVEARTFALLLAREIVSREAIMTVIYGTASDPPHERIVDVRMAHMRRKLAPWNIRIATRWGVGWYLTPEAKRRAQGLLSNDQRAVA